MIKDQKIIRGYLADNILDQITEYMEYDGYYYQEIIDKYKQKNIIPIELFSLENNYCSKNESDLDWR